MKCPNCSRRRVRTLSTDRYKCRKCRHTWKVIRNKVEPKE